MVGVGGSLRENTTQKEKDFKVTTVYMSLRYKKGIASVGLEHGVIKKEHSEDVYNSEDEFCATWIIF